MRRTLQIVALLCGVAMLSPSALLAQEAQEALSISVTPPLFQLSIAPGDTWTSSLKVVNNNAYEVTYYSQVVDFEAEGEGGQGKFMPLIKTEDDSVAGSYTLASWIEVSAGPVTVPKGKSGEIPFTVKIPMDAPPGGHYAAILVGTKPPETEIGGGPSVKISSLVSSLLFVRIKGEAEESGRIREFRSTKELYQEPQADFVLRFENIGNTHLRPQGDITLYNMWGKERGKVVINQKNGGFGSVLPNSTRKFQFSWEGEQDISDIGRYSAEVTLTFGDEARQNISAKTYFWIVPIMPASVALGTIVLFVLIFAWFIRRYIRRALALEQGRMGVVEDSAVPASAYKFETLVEPLKEGVVDLRRVAGGASAQKEALGSRVAEGSDTLTIGQFLRKYKVFFLFVLVIIIGGMGVRHYFGKVMTPERQFQISDVKIEEVPILDTPPIGQ